MSISEEVFLAEAKAAGLYCQGGNYAPWVCAWPVPIRGYFLLHLPDEGGCITIIPNVSLTSDKMRTAGIGRFDCFEYALASLLLLQEPQA